MEHIVQFAIGIDDETIRKRVEEHAYDDIIVKLSNEAKRNLPKRYGDVNWEYLAAKSVDKFIEENKDTIIDVAANMLYESFKRTKKYRETMGKAIDDALEEK